MLSAYQTIDEACLNAPLLRLMAGPLDKDRLRDHFELSYSSPAGDLYVNFSVTRSRPNYLEAKVHAVYDKPRPRKNMYFLEDDDVETPASAWSQVKVDDKDYGYCATYSITSWDADADCHSVCDTLAKILEGVGVRP